MKKSSKLISLLLALVIATSCFAGFAAFTASAADEETKIYFEVPTLEEWGTTKSVYCHVYNVYGGTPLKSTAWQSKSESCKAANTEKTLYYFDLSKLGTIEEGADYALLFSTKDTDGKPHQTCNVTFSKECLGGTVYVTGNMIENTEDSSKLDFEASWREPALAEKYGAKAAITSTAKVVGSFFPVYQPKEQIVSQAIASWAVLNADTFYTAEAVQNLCVQMGVEPIDVYNQYAEDYAEQLADPENNPNLASLETVATLLNVDPNATTEAPTTEQPTTEEPTTEEPTTEEPTTEEPTTEEPTTEEPTTEPTEPVVLYGDVNGDGIISIIDATEIQKMGLGIIEDTELANVNGDSRVSILDVTCVQKYLVGGYENTGLVGTPYVA